MILIQLLEQGIRTRAGDKDPGTPGSKPSDKILKYPVQDTLSEG